MAGNFKRNSLDGLGLYSAQHGLSEGYRAFFKSGRRNGFGQNIFIHPSSSILIHPSMHHHIFRLRYCHYFFKNGDSIEGYDEEEARVGTGIYTFEDGEQEIETVTADGSDSIDNTG